MLRKFVFIHILLSQKPNTDSRSQPCKVTSAQANQPSLNPGVLVERFIITLFTSQYQNIKRSIREQYKLIPLALRWAEGVFTPARLQKHHSLGRSSEKMLSACSLRVLDQERKIRRSSRNGHSPSHDHSSQVSSRAQGDTLLIIHAPVKVECIRGLTSERVRILPITRKWRILHTLNQEMVLLVV